MKSLWLLAPPFVAFLLIPRASQADGAAAPAGSATASPSASSSTPNRLDFSVPDVPAFTALGVSPSKISQPTNVKDFVAALASGVSPDGHLQSGIAIEASPVKIVDNALHGGADTSKAWQEWLGGLRASFGTNTVAAGANTNNQWALGFRWSILSYTPETDRDLNRCIAQFIPVPVIEAHLAADSLPPGVSASPTTSGTTSYVWKNTALTSTPTDQKADNAEDKTYSAKCRAAGQAANLAQSGVELAYVYSEQAINSTELSSFAALGDTAWFSGSIGYNSYKFPTVAPGPSSRADWQKGLGGDPSGAWGLQATGFVRYDSTKLSDSGWQSNVFVAARVALRAQTWSLFGEAGYKAANVTDHSVPPATSTNGAPVGIGGDVRLADGTWFGLYAGYDAVTGQILSLGNIKWSIGQSRPY